MAVKKSARRKRKEDDNSGESESELRLAPPEEKNGAKRKQNSTDEGTLAVNTGDLKLPQELTEEDEEAPGFLSIDPVVLAILCFSLIFIASIAYVIWNGWEPPTP